MPRNEIHRRCKQRKCRRRKWKMKHIKINTKFIWIVYWNGKWFGGCRLQTNFVQLDMSLFTCNCNSSIHYCLLHFVIVFHLSRYRMELALGARNFQSSYQIWIGICCSHFIFCHCSNNRLSLLNFNQKSIEFWFDVKLAYILVLISISS